MERYVVFWVVLVAGLAVALLAYGSNEPKIETPAIMSQERVIGRIGEGYFNFEVADTYEKRTLGLSGREQLADTEAMLFVFEQPGIHCFWMKDMKFSIDIMWFDESRQLIYEQHDVSPQGYPDSLCPDQPARYVVETTAGAAEKNQLKIGDMLDVDL